MVDAEGLQRAAEAVPSWQMMGAEGLRRAPGVPDGTGGRAVPAAALAVPLHLQLTCNDAFVQSCQDDLSLMHSCCTRGALWYV